MAEDNTILCLCSNVTTERIRKVVEAGADSVKEVREAVHYGNSCGMCVPIVEAFIEKLLGNDKKGEN